MGLLVQQQEMKTVEFVSYYLTSALVFEILATVKTMKLANFFIIT